MANNLPIEKQTQVIAALAEGVSIRGIERMTNIHRDTIMRLGVKIGEGCTKLLDEKMNGLNSKRIEVDEIWGFVGAKDRTLPYAKHAHYGSVWTFVAVDAETKVVPCFKVGKRDATTANAFVDDLSLRLKHRIQLSADGLPAYVDAVKRAFDSDGVDFGQIVKTYSNPIEGDRSAAVRYSPGAVVSVERGAVFGAPDFDTISTSYIESQNLTMRMHIRRLTRLTNAFSKKFENFKAAIGLHFAYYNLVKRHTTLRMTPAMAAGVERDFWTVGDLVEAVL
jgi:IS1 family transposase